MQPQGARSYRSARRTGIHAGGVVSDRAEGAGNYILVYKSLVAWAVLPMPLLRQLRQNLKTQRFVQRALQFLVKKKSISVSTAILSFL